MKKILNRCTRRNYTLSILKPIFIQNWSWELKLVNNFFWGNKNLKAQISNRQDVLAKQTTQATLGFAQRNAEGYGFVTEDGHESGKGVSWGFLGPGFSHRVFLWVLVSTWGLKKSLQIRFFVNLLVEVVFFYFFAFFLLKKMGDWRLPKTFREGAVSLQCRVRVKFGVTQILKVDDWRTPRWNSK